MSQLEMFDPLSLGRRPPKYPDRLFYGLRPPPVLARAMQAYGDEMAARFDGRRKAPSHNLHLSLNGIAQAPAFDDAVIAQAQRIGDAVTAQGFDLVFDRLMSFRQEAPHPIVLTCTEGATDLSDLHAAIGREMVRAGLPTPKPGAIPHVTLWYSDRALPTQGLSSPLRWHVDDFWLIHSHTGQGRHECPGHWRLDG